MFYPLLGDSRGVFLVATFTLVTCSTPPPPKKTSTCPPPPPPILILSSLPLSPVQFSSLASCNWESPLGIPPKLPNHHVRCWRIPSKRQLFSSKLSPSQYARLRENLAIFPSLNAMMTSLQLVPLLRTVTCFILHYCHQFLSTHTYLLPLSALPSYVSCLVVAPVTL